MENLINTKPIILIGTHRSGTTWLGQALSKHPDLAYWVEPRYVWSWGNNYKPNDLLTEADATPQVVAHILQRFDQFVKSRNKRRLFEKTPSNCLRIPFIRTVYPNAKIIHVIRDGRAVFSSATEIVTDGFYRPNLLKHRLLEMLTETAIWEWPAHAPRVMEILGSKLLHKPLKIWGPRPPGWQNWVKHDSLEVLLAKQWSATVSQAVFDSNSLDTEHYYRFRYEDLMENPNKTLNKIFDFSELSHADNLVSSIANTVDSSRQHKWRDELNPEVLEAIRPWIAPTLNTLGYSW